MVELHLHLDGSLDVCDILEFASLGSVELPSYSPDKLKEYLTVNRNCNSLIEYLSKFDIPLSVLQKEECISKAVYNLLKRQSQQGIIYTEIRFAPCLHTNQGLSQYEVVKAAIQGLKNALNDFDTEARLILCLMRGKDNAQNEETLNVAQKFFGCGVAAVDLAGGEINFPCEQFTDLFSKAKNINIPFTIHAGEALGYENVKSALDLGAVRIGHGIHSVENEELMNYLSENRIVLETCFTSNLQTKAVLNPSEYPLKTFIEKGIPAAVCTDNSTVSDTNLKNEYLKLKEFFGFDNEELKELCKNAISGAFVCTNTKRKLYERVENNFENWIK